RTDPVRPGTGARPHPQGRRRRSRALRRLPLARPGLLRTRPRLLPALSRGFTHGGRDAGLAESLDPRRGRLEGLSLAAGHGRARCRARQGPASLRTPRLWSVKPWSVKPWSVKPWSVKPWSVKPWSV